MGYNLRERGEGEGERYNVICIYMHTENNKQDKEIIIDTSRLRDRERVRESERARERQRETERQSEKERDIEIGRHLNRIV